MAFVVQQRAARLERMKSAGGQIALAGQHFIDHFFRNFGAKAVNANHPFLHAAPERAAFPAAVKYGPGALRVVVTPLVRDGQKLRVGRELAHVGVVGNGQLAALLRCAHHGGRAGVKGNHVNAVVEECHGGFTLARRVKPGAQPHHLDRGLRVDRAHAQRKGIDALDHLRDRKTRHIAGAARHAASGNAGQVAALVIARIGHCNIGRGLVTGDGLELDVRELFGHLERGLHIAKAGRENQLVSLPRQVTNHAFGVSAFSDVFDISGLDLAAQRSLDLLAGLLVLLHPAGFSNGRDMDEPDFERRLDRRRRLRKNG